MKDYNRTLRNLRVSHTVSSRYIYDLFFSSVSKFFLWFFFLYFGFHKSRPGRCVGHSLSVGLLFCSPGPPWSVYVFVRLQHSFCQCRFVCFAQEDSFLNACSVSWPIYAWAPEVRCARLNIFSCAHACDEVCPGSRHLWARRFRIGSSPAR